MQVGERQVLKFVIRTYVNPLWVKPAVIAKAKAKVKKRVPHFWWMSWWLVSLFSGRKWSKETQGYIKTIWEMSMRQAQTCMFAYKIAADSLIRGVDQLFVIEPIENVALPVMAPVTVSIEFDDTIWPVIGQKVAELNNKMATESKKWQVWSDLTSLELRDNIKYYMTPVVYGKP